MPKNLDRPIQARGNRPQQIFRPPDEQSGIIDDQHQRKSRQQLEQFGRPVNAPQQYNFDQGPECTDQQGGRDQTEPEPKWTLAKLLDDRIGHIDTQHVQRTVRKVDDARDTENEREPRSHQKQR